ncbi:proteasome assembly chaperone family protein [Methanobrevibacter sp.]|uniref:proteasome assembly chaperone family protein n=1 Tax=Methanobrevibacter sp. TaxID=66852 RepID=UPI0025DC8ED9|nr:proteasome assembly chaperone family protein [Methanobrevibacter sp.]MBR4447290.1 proteasome assembly chaperone family protein [Methanobrevibacter sp.]
MNTAEINVLEEIELDNPIFIEALPGLGHVGKLAADHMIDELEATKFAEIHSPTFPPQVLVRDEGIIENMYNELYYLRDVGEDNLDLIILVGNTQALSPEGQYLVCKEILDFVSKNYNIDRIFTLGGMATTPQPVENPKIFGAATNEANVELLREAEIEIRSNDGGIVGASGLFLGLGVRQGIHGMCLMGETPGYFIDAEAAEALLKKLSHILNFEINVDKLDERAEETRQMIAKAQQMEQDLINKANAGNADDLRYIG